MRTPFHLSAFGNKAYVVVVVVTHVPLIFSFYSLLDGNMQEDIYDRLELFYFLNDLLYCCY